MLRSPRGELVGVDKGVPDVGLPMGEVVALDSSSRLESLTARKVAAWRIAGALEMEEELGLGFSMLSVVAAEVLLLLLAGLRDMLPLTRARKGVRSCSATASLVTRGEKEPPSATDDPVFTKCIEEAFVRRVAANWARANNSRSVVKTLRRPAVDERSHEFIETTDSDLERCKSRLAVLLPALANFSVSARNSARICTGLLPGDEPLLERKPVDLTRVNGDIKFERTASAIRAASFAPSGCIAIGLGIPFGAMLAELVAASLLLEEERDPTSAALVSFRES